MRKSKEKVIWENLNVSGIAAEGKAIAKINDMIVFISGGAIPGDIVNVLVKKNKKTYAEASLINVVKQADYACAPLCEHFGVCGGCTHQRLPYEKQLEYKKQQVEDQLTRLGKLENPIIHSVIPSEKTVYYRNKLEYTFSSKRWLTTEEIGNDGTLNTNGLGFHIPGKFDKILDIKKCMLQPDPSNQIRLFVKETAQKQDLDFFEPRNQEGFMRNIIIRTSSTGEVMVIVVFFYEDPSKISKLLEAVKNEFPSITSLNYIINPKQNDSVGDLNVVCRYGQPYIIEKMEGLTFRVGPKSFYQTNSHQAYKLYQKVRDYAALSGNEILYDLYTGTGTIANFLANKTKKTVGIEYVPEAIVDAKVNSEINDIKNTAFFAGDIKDVLNKEFTEANGHPDVVVLDPPRAGIHPSVLKTIIDIAPQRIVYVSCNPATQARDIAELSLYYRFVEATPVDMFPHTHHIENVALLEKL